MYNGGGGRPGNNWDGHLPSDPMERKILNAIEGIEDEDGRPEGFLKQDDEDMRAVFRTQRVNTGPKGVREDAKRHYAMEKLKAQAEAVRRVNEPLECSGRAESRARREIRRDQVAERRVVSVLKHAEQQHRRVPRGGDAWKDGG